MKPVQILGLVMVLGAIGSLAFLTHIIPWGQITRTSTSMSGYPPDLVIIAFGYLPTLGGLAGGIACLTQRGNE